jgi:hypothetical protein
LAKSVQDVVNRIQTTAKLTGLKSLVEKLRSEQPDHWRMVVFTGRRETQTTIQVFLEERGISCGLINGDSGSRNQQTIARLKKNPPEIHVIVSTEAGSEGVNLQAANVLVNYDLPWNPMIVEQRIGRIQRLASEHASVCIFNVILQGTFEEFIVARLMEKLQLASHAIGDVEALLEASNLDGGEEDNSTSFEEKIRQLVIASLAGKDVEVATQKAEKSISKAKAELEREENNINTLLGGMGNAIEAGPRCPRLPPVQHLMDARSFVLETLRYLGARLSALPNGLFDLDFEGKQDLIRFDSNEVFGARSTLFAPGSAAFERLVSRITNFGWHRVEDSDQNPTERADELARDWVRRFGGVFKEALLMEVIRCFKGTALTRVRATVAHDGYERLLEIACSPGEHQSTMTQVGLEPINELMENPVSVGILPDKLMEKAVSDPNISDFCRFYTQRRTQEVSAAGDDMRRKKKLEDDFTPRFEVSLVGLEGTVHRQLRMNVSYGFEPGSQYVSTLTLTPSTDEISDAPEMDKCLKTGQIVPRDCLDKCAVSNTQVLRHLLVRSELSGRMALPEYTTLCDLTSKRVLTDEVEASAITGKLVTKTLLKTSPISSKRAEPQFFFKCEFSGSGVLEGELAVSQVSGKRYRIDEQLHSSVSGKTGHRQEFILCSETNQPLLPTEAERCAVTGKSVMPGILELCEVSGKKVLPSELEKSAATGKKALRKYFVSSSLSSARLLEEEAIRSISGKYCAPLEAKPCLWSGRKCHPEDLKICALTGLPIHVEYLTSNGELRLEPLANLLDGIRKKSDKPNLWTLVADSTAPAIGSGRNKVDAAQLSPDGQHLAVSIEVRTWVGLKVRHAGLLYSIQDRASAGRVVIGKRGDKGWVRN